MNLTKNGLELTLEYTEPTTNTDGSPLDDLHHTSIFYDLGTGPVNVIDLPASLMTGGGAKSYSFFIPGISERLINAQVWATATDNNDNSSPPSPVIDVVIDMRIPSPPF